MAASQRRAAHRRLLDESDWDNQWLTGGLEPDVIAEAHLDPKSILDGVSRFAKDRSKRLDRTKALLGKLV